MTTFEERVYVLCKEGQDHPYKTIVRNLSFDILKFFDGDRGKQPSREEVILSTYEVENILDVINPKLTKDMSFLQRLRDAMQEWHGDKLNTNLILGIPKEC